MKNALVGYTGFVGSNICEKGSFDALYNSKNIGEAYGTKPDLLVFTGLRAEKYLANNAPDKDLEQIRTAQDNILKIAPKRLVLISSIDVFGKPSGVDENSKIDTTSLHAYGYNRCLFESFVRENYPDALIIRLPGLYGKNIKKNFIYDYINLIPTMLKEGKFLELAAKEPLLNDYYVNKDNGFYKLNLEGNGEPKEKLKEAFKKLGFSALNFTDSRSRYQFYDLSRLWDDIETALAAGLKVWHPATEPVSAGELYHYLCGQEFVNELPGTPADYDCRTVYCSLFGGEGGYIMNADEVKQGIREFVHNYAGV
ncbi:MAG: NAD(P)-dependent oxidoreductase [Lachnospiraceae bacterium]|nr:NAD(P)-dependent oxidoreductase [Lachnospiraceae bacterium]